MYILVSAACATRTRASSVPPIGSSSEPGELAASTAASQPPCSLGELASAVWPRAQYKRLKKAQADTYAQAANYSLRANRISSRKHWLCWRSPDASERQ